MVSKLEFRSSWRWYTCTETCRRYVCNVYTVRFVGAINWVHWPTKYKEWTTLKYF